jgi:hypothetical protein
MLKPKGGRLRSGLPNIRPASLRLFLSARSLRQFSRTWPLGSHTLKPLNDASSLRLQTRKGDAVSHGEEIWKWNDAQKRLEEARTITGSEMSRLESAVYEATKWRRLYEAQSVELARLQKRVEALESALQDYAP